jgi:hypothetical protein
MALFTSYAKQCFSTMSLPLISKVKGVYRYSDDINLSYKPGEKVIDIYSDEESIGLVQYNINTGEIGMMILHQKFRNIGLGKYILNNIIDEMKQNQNKEVWAISNKNHEFWQNVNNKSFNYRFPAHPTTKYGGFYMKL